MFLNAYNLIIRVAANGTKAKPRRLKTERYLLRQVNTTHKISIKLSLSSIGQEK